VAYITFEKEQHGFRMAQNIKRALEAELYFYARIFGFQPADPIEPVAYFRNGLGIGLGHLEVGAHRLRAGDKEPDTRTSQQVLGAIVSCRNGKRFNWKLVLARQA